VAARKTERSKGEQKVSGEKATHTLILFMAPALKCEREMKAVIAQADFPSKTFAFAVRDSALHMDRNTRAMRQ
jgi:hypothetical protein